MHGPGGYLSVPTSTDLRKVRRPSLERNLRHLGRRRRVRHPARGFRIHSRGRYGDPTLGAIAGGGPLRDRPRSAARVLSFLMEKVVEGRRESRGSGYAVLEVGI